jgi:GntR family transcriptional regulator
MLWKIHPDGPVPIYEQIEAQVIFNIASAALETGTMLPSIRELAQELVVHPNTVARAFQDLERQGIITAKRGRGMEVTEDAPRICHERRQEIVRGRIRDALREAVTSALPAEEIHRLVEEELAHVNGHRKRK